jgi:hypothetical protein
MADVSIRVISPVSGEVSRNAVLIGITKQLSRRFLALSILVRPVGNLFDLLHETVIAEAQLGHLRRDQASFCLDQISSVNLASSFDHRTASALPLVGCP